MCRISYACAHMRTQFTYEKLQKKRQGNKKISLSNKIKLDSLPRTKSMFIFLQNVLA